ncbi:MAG: hypothetical protein GY841_12495 [FCB group bacterium]|nr:hypothetical protein [FCB group bacterium]
MTLQTIKGGLVIPDGFMTTSAINSLTMDAENEEIAFIIECPKAGDITDVGFITGTVDQATNGLTVRIEDVDESVQPSVPDGNLAAAGATETGIAVASNTRYWANLDTALTVTAGQLIAVRISFTTWAAGNDVDLLMRSPMLLGASLFPYSLLNAGGWTGNDDFPICALRYTTDIYPLAQGFFAKTLAYDLFNNTDLPDRIGLYFKLPFPARISGISTYMDVDGDFKFVVYDSDGIEANALYTSRTFDKDVRPATLADVLFHNIAIGDRPSIAKDTYYRVCVVPTSGTDTRLYHFTFEAAADMDAMSGGDEFHYTANNTDPPIEESDWTQTTTKRPLIWLTFDQFDDGVSTGGGPTVGPFEVGPFR